MIEYQSLTSTIWHEVPEFQLIRLVNIKFFRFRFYGQLVKSRKSLNEYLEKEIIMARLAGIKVDANWLANYKNDYQH